MKFIFVILCLVVVSEEGFAEKCEEDNFNQCLTKVGVVIEQLTSMHESGKDFTSYCPTLEQEGQCIKHISKTCKDDFPKVSILVSMHNLMLSEFCGENGKMYMDMAPCLKANEAAFEKCVPKGINSFEDIVCTMVAYLQCTAKISKEKCKNGEAYGKGLEKRMETMKIDECSSAGNLSNSFLTFATAVLSAILIRNKLQ